MTVILVLATFVSFIVLKRFSGKEATDYVPQTTARDQAEEGETQPIIASSEVDRRVHAGIDRRQIDRRKRAA